MARSQRPKKESAGRSPVRRARVEELEPRVLLSADAPWAVLDATLSDARHAPLESVEAQSARNGALTSTEQHAWTQELVFVDAGIDDYESLVDDLLAQDPDARRSIEVVVLDRDRDGISQISEALTGRSDLDAVHVVSHGSEEGIQLGGTWLTRGSLDAYADSVAGWRDTLSEDADLLLYGCNLAGSTEGKALIEQLAGLTGADVAASLDATGAALLGGDWELEYATGSVEANVAFSAQARATFSGVLDGTAIWIDQGETTPQASPFDGLDFGPSVPTVDVGNTWKVVAGAESPTRNEAIVAGVGSDGNLSAMVWNGTAWVNMEPFGLGLPDQSGTENWSIDVSYESQSGDALIVWSTGDLGFDFAYSVWDGTSFSAPIPLIGPAPGEVIQLKLASDPTSDEIMLVTANLNNETTAFVWDGSSWNAGTHFVNGSSSVDVTDISVAYEQQSGDAMVVFGNTSNDAHYRLWDGSSWSGGPIADGGGPGGSVQWTTLAADPTSDRIVLGVSTEFQTAWFAVWDGDAWEPSVLASNNTLHSDRQNVAVAFETTSGEAIAAYTFFNDNTVYYQRWTAGAGWSGELAGPTFSTHPDSMTLDADPTNDTLVLSLVEQDRKVSFSAWDGDAWGTPEVLGTDAGTNRGQPFLFLWDSLTALAPTADASAGAPHVISEGGTLILDGSASSDPDGSIVSWEWDVRGDGSFETTGENASLDWAELIAAGVDDDGTYDVALRVTDDGGAQGTEVFTLTVDNSAPTITVSGPATIEQGQVFTLDLSAVDFGSETIIGWTINWGDGTIDTVGDVATASHTYLQAGFTHNITVSVRDEDGTYSPGDLFLTSNNTDSLFRYDATTGALLSEFADLDGLDNPIDVEIGPDGLIYVTGFASGDIRRYDATTGAFVDQFVTGLSSPSRMAFGPDGNLYVSNSGTDEVLRFDGATGASMGAFVSAGSGTLEFPDGIAFGPDGNLYVASDNNSKIFRYDGTSGAFIDQFAAIGSSGFTDLKFGPDGNLYVSNVNLDSIQRFDGTSGIKIDDFVAAGSGGTSGAAGFEWGPDGHLYVVDFYDDLVLRFNGTNGSFIDEFIPPSVANQPVNLTFAPAHQVLVTPELNAAPVLSPTGPNLTAITEDDLTNPGDLVSSIVGGSITDANSTAVEGIAITGLNSSNGSWEYSIDAGASWVAVPPAVSDATALLLRDDDLVRFVPDGQNGDSASFDFRAWDQTEGTEGGLFDANTNGGTTAFSSNFDTASIVASDVNDAPVLNNVATPVLNDVAENAGPPVGAVGTLISDLVGLVGAGGLDNVSDVDSGAVTGIGVSSADGTDGTWHYSIDGGATWQVLGAVNANNARLLAADADTRIYFQPNPDFNGTILDALDFRAWDRTSGVNGGTVDMVPFGGENAFSQNPDSADISVTRVDYAPIGTDVTLTTDEDAPYVFTTNDFGFSDPDGDLFGGVVITTAPLAGTLRNGVTVLTDGDFVSAAAIVAGDLVFVPAPDASGTPYVSLSFQVRDDSGVPGLDTDPTPNIMTFNVAPLNDAPTLVPASPTLTPITEDDLTNAGDLVSDLLGSSVTDADGAVVEGIAITSLTSSNGSWQYSTDAGASWIVVPPSVSDATALLLRDVDRIRFVPDGQNSDTASFEFRAWDQTTGTQGSLVDVNLNGGGTAFSTDFDTARIDVTPINDAPTLANTIAGQLVTDVTTVDPFSTVTITDIDTPAQTLTVDIQLDDVAKGVLTDLGGFTNLGGGLYRFTGTAGAATIALQGLTFDPAENRAAPGATETTTFTISVDDGVAAPVVNANTTVISTAVNDAPAIANTVAGQTVTDKATVAPFLTVTITDADSPGQMLTVDIQLDDVAKGVLTDLGGFTNLGGGLYRFTGTAGAATLALQGLTFDPAENRVAPGATETTTFTITVDDGVATPYVDATTTVLSTSINDAPVLDPAGDMTLVDVSESDPNPVGNDVATIIASAGGDRITDVDAGALEGIAVVGVDDTNGSWQYSTDGGGIWTDFGLVSDTSAVLLDSSALVRFVPSVGYIGSAGDILFHAWDQTTGSNGQTNANVMNPGGTTAFSLASETATLDVNVQNFAPVLTPSTPTLSTITEDDVGNTGELVSTIIGGSISDANLGALEGIAITGLSSGNGVWQHSLDGGATWSGVAATVSDSAALLLRESDRIRFVPDARNADAASFDFRAWDQTSGSAGTTVNATSGGQSAFSGAADTASITVTGLNDAPSLGGAALSPIANDDADPAGATIASLFAGSFSDVDTGSGFGGLAVIGNAADAVTQGVWQYSSDGGTSWFAVGGVSDDASAIALASTTQLRFVPVSTFQGNPPALIIRGLDDSYSGGFSSTAGGFEARAQIDTSTNGGQSETSAASASLTTSVFPGTIAPVELPEEELTPEEDLPSETGFEDTDETSAGDDSETLPNPAPLPSELRDGLSGGGSSGEIGVWLLQGTEPRDVAADPGSQTGSSTGVRDDEDRREDSEQRSALDALSNFFQGRSLIDADALANLIFGGDRGEFMRALDSVQRDIEVLTGFEARMARSAMAATTGLSVGYVLWLTRGGLLVASLLSSLPAWRLIDPIPILASLNLDEDERRNDEESLDSLVRSESDKLADRPADEMERGALEGETWDS